VHNFADVAVIIPSLHPSPALADTIRGIRARGFSRILVVDDGSGPDYAHVFEAVRADFGVELLVHSKNMGKGCALKTAFEYCSTTAPEITCVVTADSDGQHSPEDIEAVANRLLDNRASATTAAVLGVRDFSGAGVPWKSRLGNRLTSGLVRILFGRRVTDTQTGLRGFPAELLTLLESVRGNGFEYEMNSLMALMRHCINVQEVGIQTIYHDMQNSQSHFRPLIDSMRIYAQILRFGASSLVGAAVDLTLFALFVSVLYGGSRNAQGIVIAIVLARIGSATVNYWLNRGFVFHEKATAWLSLLRYSMLAVVLLAASATGSVLLSRILGGHVVFAKTAVDLTLFLASFAAQRAWVFSRGSGYGIALAASPATSTTPRSTAP